MTEPEKEKTLDEKFDAILLKLEYIDNRVNNVKGWVTFIGIIVLLGLIAAVASPMCAAIVR